MSNQMTGVKHLKSVYRKASERQYPSREAFYEDLHDAIEQVKSEYVPLPRDMSGEVIRIGDYVRVLSTRSSEQVVSITHYRDMTCLNRALHPNTVVLRHETLEDAMRSIMRELGYEGVSNSTVQRYAQRIRRACGR